jgi:hypothetical protein
MPRPLAAVALLASLLACSTTPKPPAEVPMTPPAPDPGQFRAKGEVIWKDLSGASPARRATFDDWRVNGPSVALRRTSEGSWSGRLRGRDVVLVTGPGRVEGGDVRLSLTFDDKGAVVMEGLWGGQRVRLVLARDRVSGVLPSGPIDLTEMGSGMFNSWQGLLQVGGPSDMPQVALALLDVLVP